MAWRRLRAREAWRRSYETPLAVAAGQTVSVGRRDSDWPDFLWCRGAGGREGWLPETILAVEDMTARVIEDYDAIELSVAAGDIVEGQRALADWIWCRDTAGEEGWLPERLLEAVTD